MYVFFTSLVKLNLGDNCLSDSGLRKMTAPVRVMKRGLKNLEHLDLSCKLIIITVFIILKAK